MPKKMPRQFLNGTLRGDRVTAIVGTPFIDNSWHKASAQRAVRKLGRSVDNLVETPSIENAIKTQYINGNAWAALAVLYSSGGYYPGINQRFIDSSYRCLNAVRAVTEEDNFTLRKHGTGNYITGLLENIQRRIRLAETMRDNGYSALGRRVDKEYEELKKVS